ncbi:NhaP-type Na+/H+ or K+/H+ antiporter [Burkholderia anthina]|nr:NhaP-type Na+/H+ or K+/H+ antiporter [Burkholderia anthina]
MDDDRDGARNVMVGPSVARHVPGGCPPSSKLRARRAEPMRRMAAPRRRTIVARHPRTVSVRTHRPLERIRYVGTLHSVRSFHSPHPPSRWKSSSPSSFCC